VTTNGRTEKEQDEREVAERGMWRWRLRIRPLSPLLSSFLFLPAFCSSYSREESIFTDYEKGEINELYVLPLQPDL